MKRSLHILTVVLALYVAVVGCGVNISHYCCHECQVQHECLCHHHHNINQDAELEAGSHCGVTHIAAPVSITPQHFDIIPDVAPGLPAEATHPCFLALEELSRTNILSYAPPVSGGRTLLARFSTLLI